MPKRLTFFVSVSTDVASAYLTPDGIYRFTIESQGSQRLTLSALWAAIMESIYNLTYADEKEIGIFDENGKRMRPPLFLFTDDPGHYTNHGRVDHDVTYAQIPMVLDRPLLSL